MQIMDQNGRVGEVTEYREEGAVIFARPASDQYIMQHTIPGIGRCQVITATAWHRESDGSYTGLWHDSPHGERVAANLTA